MAINSILRKLDPVSKEFSDNLTSATKRHLGKIKRSYSEKFSEVLVPEIEEIRESRKPKDYSFVTPDMRKKKLYSVLVFIDSYKTSFHESMSKKSSKSVRILRSIKNQGVELSVIAGGKSGVLNKVEKFMESLSIPHDSYKIVEVTKLY